MSANTVAVEQPEQFKFTPANRKRAKALIAKYPAGRQASAVVPLLDLAQRQNGGWLPRAAIEYVAALLEMPVIRVWEVATFYTMLNLKPVGRHLVQLCTATPCWLMGSDAILEAVKVREDAIAVVEHQGATLPPSRSLSVVGPGLGAEPWRPACEPGAGRSPSLRALRTASVLSGSRSS